jgi:hypothetical protein
MGTASLHFDAWSLAWRELLQKWAPACGHSDCMLTKSLWRRFRGKPRGVVLQGLRYCRDECVERALSDALRRILSTSHRALAPHRVPLGLLLLSRQQLTVEQLRAALAAQHSAGRGRIGEWLLTLGFVSEPQVTAALARQWSCPVLLTNSFASCNPSPCSSRAPQIPITLLQSFVMIPVDYVESTATLHMAFGEGIDYGHALSGHRGDCEVVFDRVADGAEFSRIVRSYCARLAASEIRLAACGPHLWVRLLRPPHPPLDLLLLDLLQRSPRDASPRRSLPVTYSAFSAV